MAMTTAFGYCPRCGTALSVAGQAFCGLCGLPFVTAPLAPPAPQADAWAGYPPTAPVPPAYAWVGYGPAAPDRNKMLPALLLTGGMAILVVIGALVLILAGARVSGNSYPGTITLNPSTISCSSNQLVKSTITLPASLNASDKITFELDGVSAGTTSVSDAFQKQSDGSWLYSSSSSSDSAQNCSGINGSALSMGAHTIRIVDSRGTVLAEFTYTLTP
jgi:hypothetical protein